MGRQEGGGLVGTVLRYKGRERKGSKSTLAFIYIYCLKIHSTPCRLYLPTYLPTYLPYTKAAVALPTALRVEVEVSILGDDT